jgi:G3E family GTPase
LKNVAIPVTVVTGFLGSGKTTIIMNLLSQLEHPERVVWLKNEYGNVNIDKLAVESTHVKVSEIMNGCLCCVLVGRLGNALREIIDSYAPERIIIETSGTAYPAPIVWEIKKFADLRLDGVINVVDALNFSGYEDKSYSATLQSKYIDLIVINKYPDVRPGSKQEQELETRLDDVYELNPHTPKVKSMSGNVSKQLLIGLNPQEMDFSESDMGQEVDSHDHQDEVEVVELSWGGGLACNRGEFEKEVAGLAKLKLIRIKGALITSDGPAIFNWVMGRGDWQELASGKLDELGSSLVLMGKKAASFRELLETKFKALFSKTS